MLDALRPHTVLPETTFRNLRGLLVRSTDWNKHTLSLKPQGSFSAAPSAARSSCRPGNAR